MANPAYKVHATRATELENALRGLYDAVKHKRSFYVNVDNTPKLTGIARKPSPTGVAILEAERLLNITVEG